MNLNIALIQSDIEWENIPHNLAHFEKHLQQLPKDTDIAVLPEMFATAFSMKAEEVSVELNHEVITWLKQHATTLNMAIIAGVAIKNTDNNPAQYFNSLLWAEPDKEIQLYNKRHLFRMAGEHKHFNKGDEKLIITYKGWRIRPFVCYDLRFPVWSRNVISEKKETPEYEYDCAIYIANWPEARRHHWSTLLKARAIENQSYVVGVNRVGTDAKGFLYSGDSIAIDPLGNDLTTIPSHIETTEMTTLNKENLLKYRTKFPFIADADKFQIL